MVVYKITNLINSKCYIGCTINLNSRIAKHLSGKFSGSTILYKAVNKYGKDNFEIEVLETFEDKETMYLKEKEYIQSLNTLIPNGYNIHLGGKGGKILLTEEQKATRKVNILKLVDLHKGNKYNLGRIVSKETREKISNIHKGKKLSNETKFKISLSKIGNTVNKGIVRSVEYKQKMSQIKKGKVFTEETKLRMSEAAKKRMLSTKRDCNGKIISNKIVL